MARELRKAFGSVIQNTAKVINTFADTYRINSKIEVSENLSEAEIKDCADKSLQEKSQTVKEIWDSLVD